jgi:hypothetical protein
VKIGSVSTVAGYETEQQNASILGPGREAGTFG